MNGNSVKPSSEEDEKVNVSPPAQQAEDDGEEIDDEVVGDGLPGGGGIVHQLHQRIQTEYCEHQAKVRKRGRRRNRRKRNWNKRIHLDLGSRNSSRMVYILKARSSLTKMSTYVVSLCHYDTLMPCPQ